MSFFEWIFEIFSGEKDALFYDSGMKLMARGQFTKASFEFIEAIRINPTEEKYHEAYGKALFKKGMRGEADMAFGFADDLKGIAKDPHNVKILCRLAKGFQDKRMFSVSQKYIKKAMEINPNNGQIYFLMGRANYLIDKFQGAVEQYEKALEINPYCFDAYKGLRDVYGAQGKNAKQRKFEELAKHVKRVIESPNDPAAHTASGDTFRKYNKNNLAEAGYHEALRLNDKYEKALLGIAILKFDKKDYFNAKKHFYDVIKLNKYNPDPHSYLALIYQLDSKSEKEAEWERSLAKQLKEVEKTKD